MLICTFAGHRNVVCKGLDAVVLREIEEIVSEHSEAVFLVGGMGAFDRCCAATVRAFKKSAEKHIRLVLPYMTKDINENRQYYESNFDAIMIPYEVAEAHYKAAISQRNEWMVDQSDVLIAYVNREYGGAYAALRYARKRNKRVINIADAVLTDTNPHINT